jgi:hypothetical protein
MLEELVQQGAERARLFGGLHRVLELPEYLRFAQHHRIKAAGDAEGVLHRFGLRQGVEIGLKVGARDVMELRQPVERFVRRVGVAIDFGAVAGGKDCGFLHRTLADEVGERLGERFHMERHFFPDGNRGGLVIEAEGEKLHGRHGEEVRQGSILSQIVHQGVSGW